MQPFTQHWLGRQVITYNLGLLQAPTAALADNCLASVTRCSRKPKTMVLGWCERRKCPQAGGRLF